MTSHTFGGAWTEEKLRRVEEYLRQFALIFSKNERATHLHRVYVDAFAGTGARAHNSSDGQVDTEFELFEEYVDATQFMKGSARVALDIEPAFHEYIFIERDSRYISELELLCQQYTHLSERIRIIHGDANEKLVDWIDATDWQKTRAVVFLDPYGMQVEWETLQKIAQTKAIDLWVLIPLGQGVNRLLTKNGHPPEGFADRLTRFFGTDDWKDSFYSAPAQDDLFDEPARPRKVATFPRLRDYCVKRLGAIFPAVAPEPLELTNSRNNPIFLLCFAAANPDKGDIAVRIANHILKPSRRRKSSR